MSKTINLFLLLASCLLFSSFDTLEADTVPITVEPELPQRVRAVHIPEKMVFADDTISFRRFDVRERLDRELLAFTYMHSTTFQLIKRAKIYFPIIEPILAANGVPLDFKYLAMVESYLVPTVVSPAKAAGLWQFIPSAGTQYGLEISAQVDERFHIEKSTEAFCRYIKESYALYGDWMTAAASYNAGKSRISSELAKQRAENFFDLYLNEETTRYVYRLLAAKEVIANHEAYGFFLDEEDYYHLVKTSVVAIDGSIDDWVDWADSNCISYAILKYFNAWIRAASLDNPSGKIYKVTVPHLEDLEKNYKL